MMKECYPGEFSFNNMLIIYCYTTGADTEKLSKHIWRMYDTNKVKITFASQAFMFRFPHQVYNYA